VGHQLVEGEEVDQVNKTTRSGRNKVAFQQSKKHHYVPSFYTKRWVAPSGKLVEFSRPFRTVIERCKSPEAVGFAYDLYTMPGAVASDRSALEDRFLKLIDQRASDAIEDLLLERPEDLSGPARSAFTHFLVSLLHRTPDRVQALQAGLLAEFDRQMSDLREKKAAGEGVEIPDGVSLEEAIRYSRRKTETFSWGDLLQNVIGSKLITRTIYNMKWYVRRLDDTPHTFLTNDRPLVHYNGLGQTQGHVALTLTPRRLFLATNNEMTAKNILHVPDEFLVRRVNHELCVRATAYVYGSDRSHLHFISRRLKNEYPPATPKPPPAYAWPVE
jgi:hypothetical protein